MDYPLFVKLTSLGITDKCPAIMGYSGVTFQWATPLKVADSLWDSVVVDTLATTTPVAFKMGTPYKLTPKVYWDKKLEIAKKDGRVGQYPVIFHLHGGFKSLFYNDTTTDSIVREVKNNNLIVVGNSRFIVSGGKRLNRIFMNNIVDWVTTNDNLLSIRNRTIIDRNFKKSSLEEDGNRATIYRVVNIFLMPILILIGGIVLYSTRKKSQKSGGGDD
jgi:hypothetical protein